MTKALAFVFYEKLLPGQQLVNRLHDLGYRVHALTDAATLPGEAEKQKPMLLIAEFSDDRPALAQTIASLKQNPATSHIAVLAYVAGGNSNSSESARTAGANLVASETGLIDQLPQLLEQLLQLD